MSFEGARYTLPFNGEVYNYRELREQTLQDVPLTSTGDTPVLGTLLSKQKLEDVLPKLRGMFAFAWWDTQTRSLVAARDRFGIKPLYYGQFDDGALVLSSELRVIRHLLGDKAGVSPRTLAQFF